MVRLFLSHSKYDKKILDYFDTIVARVEGVSSFRASLESFPDVESPGNTIANALRQSIAVFVLLGSGMLQSQYTMSWVGYEVGLASAWSIPVWVFEWIEDNVNFPTPHVDHYILYSMESYRPFIRELVESFQTFALGFPKPLQLLKRILKGKSTICSHCQATYNIYQDLSGG